jgi:hypothetical protein
MTELKLGERKVATGILLWLLGGWFFATLFMGFVASGNFHVMKPDYLPKAEQVYKAIPVADRPLALKYGANELNRFFFTYYDLIQVFVAVAACGLFAATRRGGKVVWACLIICLLMSLSFQFYFLPVIVDLGREIEFMPRDPANLPPEVKRFGMLHGINILMEMAKLAILFVASIPLLRSKEP